MKKTIALVLVLVLAPASISLAAEDTWARKSDMPTARCTFSTGVVNERIYAIGGAKGRTDALRRVPLQIVEEYHPATDTWTRKADMPTARNALSISVVDGRIYAIGGAEGISAPIHTVEEYNPATDTWTNKTDMPTARFALSTSAVNGKIYAIGGSGGGFKALSIVEQYDPVTDLWTKKADMPTARIHVSTSVVDGKIYAIGGVTGTSASASRAVEQYDPATDTWTRKANMPSAGCTLSTSVVNGKIYAIGGAAPMPALAPLSTVQEYDPVIDKWTNKTDMPTARSGLSTSAVNGKIYAIGGLANPTGMALATVEEYDTGFIVTPPSPDFNGDGIVDSVDICMMIDCWGTNEPLYDIAPPPFGDGIVDVQDLIVVAEHLFEGAGLVAHWALDETEGDIAYDSAGNIDAAVYNWQWTAGKIGGALLFNGLTTYMDCGDSQRLGTQKMTLVMWLEPEHMGGMRYVLSRAKEGADNFDYVLMRHLEGKVEFAVAQEGSDPVSVMSNATTPLNEWTHVAVCLDGSEATIYINGQFDTSAGYAQRIPYEDCRLWISSLGKSTRFYNGKIDDVRIYNIALTAEQIEELAR